MTESPHTASRRYRTAQQAFTLLELIITIAVVGIVAAIAYPSMQEILASQRVRAASSALYESLIAARAEALKQNATASFVTDSLANGWSVQIAGTEILAQSAIAGVTFSPADPTIELGSRGRPTTNAAIEISASNTTAKMCVQATTTGKISEQKGGC